MFQFNTVWFFANSISVSLCSPVFKQQAIKDSPNGTAVWTKLEKKFIGPSLQ
jgi:hypothetical protein